MLLYDCTSYIVHNKVWYLYSQDVSVAICDLFFPRITNLVRAATVQVYVGTSSDDTTLLLYKYAASSTRSLIGGFSLSKILLGQKIRYVWSIVISIIEATTTTTSTTRRIKFSRFRLLTKSCIIRWGFSFRESAERSFRRGRERANVGTPKTSNRNGRRLPKIRTKKFSE